MERTILFWDYIINTAYARLSRDLLAPIRDELDKGEWCLEMILNYGKLLSAKGVETRVFIDSDHQTTAKFRFHHADIGSKSSIKSTWEFRGGFVVYWLPQEIYYDRVMKNAAKAYD